MLLALGGFSVFKFLTTSQFSPLRNEVASKSNLGPKITPLTPEELKASDFFYLTSGDENILSFYSSTGIKSISGKTTPELRPLSCDLYLRSRARVRPAPRTKLTEAAYAATTIATDKSDPAGEKIHGR